MKNMKHHNIETRKNRKRRAKLNKKQARRGFKRKLVG